MYVYICIYYSTHTHIYIYIYILFALCLEILPTITPCMLLRIALAVLPKWLKHREICSTPNIHIYIYVCMYT